MLYDAVLSAFIVVGRYHKHGGRAQAFGFCSKLARLGGAVASRARNYGHATFNAVYYKRDRFVILFGKYGGGFARRAEREERAHPARYKMFDILFEDCVIDPAVFSERRNHCSAYTVK